MTWPPAEQIHEMLEALVDPVLVIDKSGIVLAANPSACAQFGWERDDLVGVKVNLLMGEPFRSDHDLYLARFLDTGERRAIGRVRQVLGRRKDGEDFPCELSVSFTMVDGEPRFYGIVRDVTERERMVARLSQVERLAAMGELAAGVAHEVNNPVNTIINCAQLVKDGDDDPKLLDDIVQEGMRIAMIVRDLLGFARDRHEQFSPFDVCAAVKRALRLVSRRIERQGITLRAEIADDALPRVDGLPHQIQQVLLNLMLNARDALVESEIEPKEITVVVDLARSDERDYVRVLVRDNGPGIPREHHGRIFEPFFTTKKSGHGTGLGLAVSRGIIDDHGGKIRVRSELGNFTEFELLLPTA